MGDVGNILVSPAEPKMFYDLGIVSSIPERYGADFLWESNGGLWGVQRKAVTDLVASLRDGRLSKELGQAASLSRFVLIVEGNWKWTTEGTSLSVPPFTLVQFRGITFSLLSQGIWVLSVATKEETTACVLHLRNWSAKKNHGSLLVRPKPADSWGMATSKDWGIHLLQSFPGIGAGVAEKIYDHFGGVPLQWTVDALDMMEIDGIGPVRAEQLMEAFSEDSR